MNPSDVAVVVTCRNQGRAIERAAQSVREQTKPPAEIVIVDRASEDLYTRQVLGRLEKTGLRVLAGAGQDVGGAWNLGIRSTRAPLIVLVEGDSQLDPTYLEKASACLSSREELAFITCAIRRTRERNSGSPRLVDSLTAIAETRISISSMFRRGAWVAVGGFDEACVGYEAVDFWASLVERGFKGVALHEPMLRAEGQDPRRTAPEPAASETERFYRKHFDTITGEAEPLLLAKERLILDLTERHELLHGRRTALETDLARVQGEIAAMRDELERLGHAAIELGDLRRTTPISPVWGLDRGLPLDRYYIESFLESHRADVRGRVLEVKDAGYTRRFGEGRVTAHDVVDIDVANLQATVVADLTQAKNIADDTYDCFVLTQVLGLIYDVPAALATAYRILKPGGVLLCTVPAAGRISYEGPGLDGDYWRFTEASVRRLFAGAFPIDRFDVTVYGNVLATAAFLYGLAPHELTREELDATDPFFPLVYGIRATKPIASVGQRTSRDTRTTGADQDRTGSSSAILMYHRIAEEAGDGRGLHVSPSNFRAQLQRLRDDGYRVISLQEIAGGLRSNRLPERSMAVTFDDGYVDALVAGEVLAGLSCPATFFVVGASLDGLREFWWDTLDRVFRSNRPTGAVLAIDMPTGPVELPTATREERVRAHARLTETLHGLACRDRDRLLRRVIDWSGVSLEGGEARPMTASELERLAAMPGIDIGAHTMNHVWLPAEARDVQIREIRTSKTRLERLLGRTISSFAYPYGAYDPASVEAVEQAGFEVAVTVEARAVTRSDAALLLPRCEIGDCDGPAFGERLRRLFDSRRASDNTLS